MPETILRMMSETFFEVEVLHGNEGAFGKGPGGFFKDDGESTALLALRRAPPTNQGTRLEEGMKEVK